LESQGRKQLEEDGVDPGRMVFQRFVEMKYRMQIHQLPVPLPTGQLNDDDLEQLVQRFEAIYESFYGKGSAYREAGVEIGLFKINAIGEMVKPSVPEQTPVQEKPVPGQRKIYWRDRGASVDTPVYAGQNLGPGHVIPGPAVVEYPETTIVIQSFAKAVVDASGNFIIDLDEEDS
jgi:N-methylhydantoinase A